MSFQFAAATGVIATFLLSTTATAATISSATVTSANQVNNDPAVVVVETDSVTDGTASASLGFNNSNAIQNADGTSEVNATISGFGFGSTRVTSEAKLEFSETNATQGTRTYSLDFTLSGLSTEISTSRSYGSNLTNPFDNPEPGVVDVDSAYTAASFEYSIQLNGVDIYTARADVLGLAEYPSPSFDLVQTYSFDNVLNFAPTITPIVPGGGFIDAFEFSVADLSGSIELGDFAAGESFDITSILTARAFATNFEGENAVGAFVQDPITISSFGFSSTPTQQPPTDPGVVPLPAAGWLLLGALGGLVAFRRRQTA